MYIVPPIWLVGSSVKIQRLRDPMSNFVSVKNFEIFFQILYC